jgi:DNA-binding NtrC family response regulator
VTGSLMHTPSSQTLPLTIPPRPRALIADDQPDVLTALRLLLRTAGYQTEAVSSPAQVLEAIKRDNFDLVYLRRRDVDGCQSRVNQSTKYQGELRWTHCCGI